MKTMTFFSSCSWCALAMLLEDRSISAADRALAVAAGLPWRLRYDEAEDAFLAGAMLQRSCDFDRALAGYDLHFEESFAARPAVPSLLAEHTTAMVGVRTGSGKHAMVFAGAEHDRWRFLNPHREGDGEPDVKTFSLPELLSRFDESAGVGWLAPGANPPACDEPQATLAAIDRYREALTSFCQTELSREALRDRRDALLRPLVLDHFAMWELAGREPPAALRELREGVFALLRGEALWADVMRPAVFHQCLDDWRSLVREGG